MWPWSINTSLGDKDNVTLVKLLIWKFIFTLHLRFQSLKRINRKKKKKIHSRIYTDLLKFTVRFQKKIQLQLEGYSRFEAASDLFSIRKNYRSWRSFWRLFAEQVKCKSMGPNIQFCVLFCQFFSAITSVPLTIVVKNLPNVSSSFLQHM